MSPELWRRRRSLLLHVVVCILLAQLPLRELLFPAAGAHAHAYSSLPFLRPPTSVSHHATLKPIAIRERQRRDIHDCSRYCDGGSSSALAAASNSLRKVEEVEEPISIQFDDLKLNGKSPGDSGRVAELDRTCTKRWRRVRSATPVQTLGRALRRCLGLWSVGVQHGESSMAATGDQLHTPVSQSRQRLAVDRGGTRRLLSALHVRRWRTRDATDRRPTDARVDGAALTREDRQESLQESGGAVAAAAASAPADFVAGVYCGEVGGDVSSVVGDAEEESNFAGVSKVGESGAVAPAKYDGAKVLPETWAKVAELRARAEKSDPNAGEEERGLHAWLASGGGDGRKGLTDADLLRFIMFRHGDVDAAWRQLKAAAGWRREHRVEAVLSEEQWSQHRELQAEMFWVGQDVEGRPTMVLRSIAHHPGAIDSDDFQRYFLFLLEQGRQLWDLGSARQLNIVIDRIGAGIKNQDPQLLATMLPVFRDAYPDIVYRCYVAPSSWIFRFVWIVAARLVDDRQRKRVLLLAGDWQSRLLEDFDASVLPPHLGGTMAEYPPKEPPPSKWLPDTSRGDSTR